jgi:hypothetical protein
MKVKNYTIYVDVKDEILCFVDCESRNVRAMKPT